MKAYNEIQKRLRNSRIKIKIPSISPVPQIILRFSIAALLFSIVTTILNQQPFYNALFYTCFEVLTVLLPGMAVILLLKFPFRTDMELLMLSYSVGYISNLVLYFLTVPWHLQKALPVAALVVSVASAIYLYKVSNKIQLEMDKKGNVICGIFLFLLLLIKQFNYSGTNLLVPAISQNVYADDCLYWIGNTIALMKQFPPRDFRSGASGYSYHYLSSMQMAVTSLVTGMRPVVLGFCYSFFEPAVLIITGGYCLFQKATKKTLLIITGFLLVLFTTGMERLMMIDYIGHLFNSPFGFDVGIGMLAILTWYLLRQQEEERLNWKIWALALLQFGVLAGVKVPMAVGALSMIGIFCLSWLFHKQIKKALLYGGPILLIFILGYLFIFNVKGYAGSSTADYLNTVLTMSDRMVIIHKDFMGLEPYMPVWLIEVLMFLVCSILYNPSIFGLMLCGIIIKVCSLRKWDTIDSVCVITGYVGVALTNYIFMVGYSQMYFVMANYIVLAYWIIKVADEIWERWNPGVGVRIQKARIAMLVVITLLVGSGIYRANLEDNVNGYPLGVSYYFLSGVHNYQAAFSGEMVMNELLFNKFASNYMNEDLSTMYAYMKENTGSDETIACSFQSRCPGVFAERYVVYRYEFRQMKEENVKEILTSLKEQGISKILTLKMDQEFIDLMKKSGMVEVVHDTAAAVLYKIK